MDMLQGEYHGVGRNFHSLHHTHELQENCPLPSAKYPTFDPHPTWQLIKRSL